jgi:hypothetical protein
MRDVWSGARGATGQDRGTVGTVGVVGTVKAQSRGRPLAVNCLRAQEEARWRGFAGVGNSQTASDSQSQTLAHHLAQRKQTVKATAAPRGAHGLPAWVFLASLRPAARCHGKSNGPAIHHVGHPLRPRDWLRLTESKEVDETPMRISALLSPPALRCWPTRFNLILALSRPLPPSPPSHPLSSHGWSIIVLDLMAC